MFSEIKDTVGRSLLVLFLIKPTIDLFWWMSINVGPLLLSPLTVTGAAVFIYFGVSRLKRGIHVPPYSRLFGVFITFNVVALFLGLLSGQNLSVIGVINVMLRMVDSYLIYGAAFLAASRSGYRDATPFVKAILIGSSVAVIANVLAIQVGYGGAKEGAVTALSLIRERGLYYDPGVLSNVAFFNLVFSVYLLHLERPRRPALRA